MTCYPDTAKWPCEPSEMAEFDEVLVAAAEEFGWTTLRRRYGQTLALCPVTVRPCPERRSFATWQEFPVAAQDTPGLAVAGQFAPYIAGGSWFNAVHGCGAVCSCFGAHGLRLPGRVTKVTEVKVDGQVLPVGSYRVDNGRWLVRMDGKFWPRTQDMALPDSEVGTFTVSYYDGTVPGALEAYAAGLLAYEWYLGITTGECRLPGNITAVTRSGVSYTIDAEAETTGIPEVDEIVRNANPHGLKTRPRISGGRRHARVTTFGPR